MNISIAKKLVLTLILAAMIPTAVTTLVCIRITDGWSAEELAGGGQGLPAEAPAATGAVRIDKNRSSAHRLLIASSGCALFLSVLAAGLVGRSVTRPVDELLAASRRMAEGGLEEEIGVERGGEVGALARSFDRVRDAARTRIDALFELNQRVGMQNEELKRYRHHLEELVRERTKALHKANENLVSEVSERKKAEGKYRTIIKNMDCGYYEVDCKGNFTFYNDSMVGICGYPEGEMRSLNSGMLAAAGDGKPRSGFFWEGWLRDKTTGLYHCEILRKDGTHRFVEASCSPMEGAGESSAGFRGVVRDVTDRLAAAAEKKKYEEKIREMERLKAVGTLAGGVAHDFNNLLMGVQGNVSLLLAELEEEGEIYRKIKQIERCVSDGAGLTRQLLGFARGGKYKVKPIDLNEAVGETARMIGRTRKEIVIRTQLAADLWVVSADRGQVEQVLMNLYINAFQAMPGGGSLTLATENVRLSSDFVAPYKVAAGRYVKIAVADTGAGMDAATCRRVFEPFFTTKEMGKGSGLGLASAFGIVENHCGIITADSVPQVGTTFSVYLPESCGEIAAERAEIKVEVCRGSETVLLVDDEEMILEVGSAMLKELGYTPMTAKTGAEAVEFFEQNASGIDLVILDMVMPDMPGGAVFDRMRGMDRNLKVMLSSGYSLRGDAEKILSRGCNDFIQKPFDMQMLSHKIRHVLDGGASSAGK